MGSGFRKWFLLAALCSTAPALANDAQYSLFPAAGGLVAARVDGSETRLGFGTDESETLKVTLKLWGEPVDSGTMEECGAGPIDFLDFENGVMLHFQDGSFEGWFLPFDASAQTAEGIGIGSTLGTVLDVLPGDVAVEETTLGYEFWGTDIFGIVTSPDKDGIVDALWSGTACIFR